MIDFRPIVRSIGDLLALPAGPVESAAAGGLTDADLARLMDVPARAATMAAFPDMFDHVAQADEFGSTWREIAAENHRQLDGDIVRLGAA